MTILEAKNLNVELGGNKIISELSFAIKQGDFLCIVGENGSGKSTLLKAVIGEIPSKSIKFTNIKQNQIGYISQRSRIDDSFPASVLEIVCSGSLNNPSFGLFYSKKLLKSAKDKLRELGIDKLSDFNFSELSGGQKQKVLLARAMMATDKLIILDEPSNNLDKKSRQDLYTALEKLNRDGVTIIMVTHDLDHGNLIGNKILSLSKNLPFFGDAEEYVRRVHHA